MRIIRLILPAVIVGALLGGLGVWRDRATHRELTATRIRLVSAENELADVRGTTTVLQDGLNSLRSDIVNLHIQGGQALTLAQIQTAIDSGRITVRGQRMLTMDDVRLALLLGQLPIKASSIQTPIGCFAQEAVLWNYFFGLTCPPPGSHP